MSAKLGTYLEALLKDSSGLKVRFASNLRCLDESFSELTNFGTSLAADHTVSGQCSGSKPFQCEHVLFLIGQTASSTVNKSSNAASPRQDVSDCIANVYSRRTRSFA